MRLGLAPQERARRAIVGLGEGQPVGALSTLQRVTSEAIAARRASEMAIARAGGILGGAVDPAAASPESDGVRVGRLMHEGSLPLFAGHSADTTTVPDRVCPASIRNSTDPASCL